MKVIGALFRLSKFFWAPLLWAAVISVFLFCAGRQRLIFWALYLGLILTAVVGIVYLVGEFYPESGSMMENDKKALPGMMPGRPKYFMEAVYRSSFRSPCDGSIRPSWRALRRSR